MTRLHFSPIDIAVIVLFFLAILALGFSARLRSNSMLQFLAAGRSLTLPVFVAALVSMWYGGVLGVGESVSYYGIGTWILLGVPYYVFAIIYALFFAERVRGAEQLSIPERLNLRYGRAVAVVAAGLIFLLAVPAAHALMLGVLVRGLSGWDLTLSVLVGTLVGASFLYKGGLLADARVSLLAFVSMYIGFLVIDGWSLIHHPLPEILHRLPEKAMLQWDGGTGWPFVISFFILGAWTLVDPGFHQRVSSSATPAIGKKGVFVSVGFWFLFDMLTLCAGLYAIVLVPNAKELDVFPAYGEAVLPAGLKAIFFCGMAGTIVSAMVGYALVSGATFGREIVARLRQGISDAEQTNWSRGGILLACVVAVLVGSWVRSVVDLWYAWSGAVVGALLLPVCFAYLRPKKARTSGRTILVSMLLAFLVSICWMVYGLSHGNADLTVAVLHNGSHWSLVLPNSNDAALAAKLAESQMISVGTLLPGLILSAVVIGLGSIRRRGKEYGPQLGGQRLQDD